MIISPRGVFAWAEKLYSSTDERPFLMFLYNWFFVCFLTCVAHREYCRTVGGLEHTTIYNRYHLKRLRAYLVVYG